MTTPRRACRARTLVAATALAGCVATVRGGDLIPVYNAVVGGRSVVLSYDSGASLYTGIGRYEGMGTCTAFFLATALPGQDYLIEAPAYAVTSPRCAADLGPDDVVTDQPGIGRIIFNYFRDSPYRRTAIPVIRTTYATTKGRPLAILELGISYVELVQLLVRPWRVPYSRPMLEGDLIAVVSAPHWYDPVDAFLRLATCRFEGIAPVVVEHTWRTFDASFNRCRDVMPSSFGSPVLSIVDRIVVGMVNTTTVYSNDVEPCALGHPCEPARNGNGTRTRKNTNYVTSVAGITACFDERHRFSAKQPDCPLDRGR
jgi:hypothetical protein